MRVVGFDLGSRRIGVAVSDPSGTIATPYSVLERTGDAATDHVAMARVVRDTGAARVVVGLPLSLDGRRGPAATAVLAEVREITAAVGVPVETWDERLTTVTAGRALADAGVPAADRRRVVDKLAASVMLQAWLDARGAPVESGTKRRRRRR